jgi:hypothetical protein
MANDLSIDAEGNIVVPTPEEMQAEIERLITLALREPAQTAEQQIEMLTRALTEYSTAMIASLFPNTFKFEDHVEVTQTCDPKTQMVTLHMRAKTDIGATILQNMKS